METFNLLQAPALILACLGIIATFVKLGRKDKTLEDHSNSIKEHDRLLREIADKGSLTKADCVAEQDRCMRRQDESNQAIIKSIVDLKKEVKDDREAGHAELMKITKSVGRIEGIISRLRFNKDGELI